MNRWNTIDQGEPTGAGGWSMGQTGPVPRDETDTLKAGNQWRGLPYEIYAALLPGVERWTSGNQKPLGGDTGLLEDALGWMPGGQGEHAAAAGLGALGYLKRQKTGNWTKLKSYNPVTNELRGEMEYLAGNQPHFSSVWSTAPKGLAEMFRGMVDDVGSNIENMTITSMLPNAVPFWRSLANSKRLDPYPAMRQRLLDMAEASDRGATKTYGYARQTMKEHGSPFNGGALDDIPRGSIRESDIATTIQPSDRWLYETQQHPRENRALNQAMQWTQPNDPIDQNWYQTVATRDMPYMYSVNIGDVRPEWHAPVFDNDAIYQKLEKLPQQDLDRLGMWRISPFSSPDRVW